jgi:hypothetical protein
MAINELWIPSPHYSTGRSGYNKIVFHTTQGAMKIRDLGSWFQNPSAQCSSHHGADGYERGVFGAYVYENYSAWTQGNANGYCLSIELCGYAEWSRSEWLDNRPVLVDNAAEWLRYMVDKYGIPWTLLSDSQAQNASVRGICQHVNLGSWGSGHWDCGSGFPIDVIVDKAKKWGGGGGTAPPQPEPVYLEDDMPVIPPNDVNDRQIAICVAGPHKDLGFCVDAAVLSGPVQLRCAFHIINGGWKVIEVTINPGNIRPVVCPRDGSNNKMSWDGLSIDRRDNMPVDIWPVLVPG